MSVRNRVLQRLLLSDATTDELEQALNKCHQTVSARVNELAKDGYVATADWSRKTRNGRNALVYKLTAAGIKAAKKVEE